jgi:hypothetical protein
MRVKKIILIITCILSLTSFAKADLNISLTKYLDENDLDKGLTQIYLLKRCSAVYAYASGIVLKLDAVSSKNFIEISNNLLFKAVELKVIEEEKKLEELKKKLKKIEKNYLVII